MKRLKSKEIDGEIVEFTEAFRKGAHAYWKGERENGGGYRYTRKGLRRAQWRDGWVCAREGEVTKEEVGPKPGTGPTAGREPCAARWVVETSEGPVGSEDRPCNKTKSYSVYFGEREVRYCEVHGRDRERIEAEHQAKRKAEEAYKTKKFDFARKFVGGLGDLLVTKKSKYSPPTGCGLVLAIECACGRTLTKTEFPNHYAHCEDV